jgi:uncharacterized protein YdaU (DUF1376 family)
MAKKAWFAWYPADWARDTKCLSSATKGIWIDILGVLWDSPTRGVKSQDWEAWARELGVSITEIKVSFDEIQKRNVATLVLECNGDVTVMSRRQVKDEKARESTRLRVRRYRGADVKRSCNGDVTQMYGECNGDSLFGSAQEVQKEQDKNKNKNKNKKEEEQDKKEEEKNKKLRLAASSKLSRPKSSETWEAYRVAYLRKYHTDPVRNKRTNSLLCQLVDRLGESEAPAVAAFYVQHNHPFYTASRHAVNLLVRDAEGLRTQWVTGVKATTLEAKSAEQRDSAVEQINRVRAEMEKRRGST